VTLQLQPLNLVGDLSCCGLTPSWGSELVERGRTGCQIGHIRGPDISLTPKRGVQCPTPGSSMARRCSSPARSGRWRPTKHLRFPLSAARSMSAPLSLQCRRCSYVASAIRESPVLSALPAIPRGYVRDIAADSGAWGARPSRHVRYGVTGCAPEDRVGIKSVLRRYPRDVRFTRASRPPRVIAVRLKSANRRHRPIARSSARLISERWIERNE
jgi:hypothetical protein